MMILTLTKKTKHIYIWGGRKREGERQTDRQTEREREREAEAPKTIFDI